MVSPAEAKLEIKRRAFYLAIGSAMYQWKIAEQSLFQLFQNLVNWPSKTLPSAIFYANDYFLQCVALTDRIIYSEGYLHTGTLVFQWEKVKSHCENANKKRNEIAHWPIVVDSTGQPTDQLQLEAYDSHLAAAKMRLKPMPSKPGLKTMNQALAERSHEEMSRSQSHRARQARKISTAEINLYAKDFHSLSGEIQDLAKRAAYITRLKTSSQSK